MSEPTSGLEQLAYKCYQKKRKQHIEREHKEEEFHENQKEAHNKAFCCYEHAELLVEEARVKKAKKGKKARVDGPNHCIHCDEDPCIFVQI
jgi:phosphopantetheinyl transferase (holo-ACP synthase)